MDKTSVALVALIVGVTLAFLYFAVFIPIWAAT